MTIITGPTLNVNIYNPQVMPLLGASALYK